MSIEYFSIFREVSIQILCHFQTVYLPLKFLSLKFPYTIHIYALHHIDLQVYSSSLCTVILTLDSVFDAQKFLFLINSIFSIFILLLVLLYHIYESNDKANVMKICPYIVFSCFVFKSITF